MGSTKIIYKNDARDALARQPGRRIIRYISVLHTMVKYITILLLLASCSVLKGVHKKEFLFVKDNRPKKLLFLLPKGKMEETFRIGEGNAKEQFYDFPDGAVFYVSRLTSWPTVNSHRVAASKSKNRLGAFSGRDERQLHWKEITLEDFRIGYAYVTAGRAEHFDDAINSVKIR